MLLGGNETERLSRISILFTLSFALLLLIGALSMAFANFMLGFVLFLLGLVLVIGNEWLELEKAKKKGRGAAFSPSAAISDVLNFAIVAYLFPSAISLFLFFTQGWGTQVLVIAVAGFTVTTVKVAAKTAQFFLAK